MIGPPPKFLKAEDGARFYARIERKHDIYVATWFARLETPTEVQSEQPAHELCRTREEARGWIHRIAHERGFPEICWLEE